MNGRVLHRVKKEINAGTTILSIPQLNKLQAGTYILGVQFTDGELQNIKVVKR